MAGVLRSSGVTQTHRYYDPLRLLIRHVVGYVFPPSLCDLRTRGNSRPDQVSQVPDVSVDARCPQPPRRVRPLVFVVTRSMAGFTLSGRLATLAFVTRPNQVHTFVLRLTSSLLQASHTGSLLSTLKSLHGERITTMISSFQLIRNVKLRLTHQSALRTPRKKERNPGQSRFSTRPNSFSGLLSALRVLSVSTSSGAGVGTHPALHSPLRALWVLRGQQILPKDD